MPIRLFPYGEILIIVQVRTVQWLLQIMQLHFIGLLRISRHLHDREIT